MYGSDQITRRSLKFGVVLAALLLMFTTQGEAAYLDLTGAGSSGTIGDGQFSQGFALSGTGRFPAFVQIGSNASVNDAYNTTVNNVGDNGQADNFNHEITVGSLGKVTVGTTEYYRFFLDINENKNDHDRYLSLDKLVVITSGTPNQSSTPLPTGTTRYDMGDNTILLDYSLEAGSGNADLVFLVKVSAFAGASSSDYVYLYSQFGAVGNKTNGVGGWAYQTGDWGTSDGFEEWAINSELTPVPEPSTYALYGLGVSMLVVSGWWRKRSKQGASA